MKHFKLSSRPLYNSFDISTFTSDIIVDEMLARTLQSFSRYISIIVMFIAFVGHFTCNNRQFLPLRLSYKLKFLTHPSLSLSLSIYIYIYSVSSSNLLSFIPFLNVSESGVHLANSV